MEEKLTSREQEIFDLLLEGKSLKEIGYDLHISYSTVDYHRANLYKKLGIHSVKELFAQYSAAALPPKGMIIPVSDLGFNTYTDTVYGGNSTAEVCISREAIDEQSIDVINIKTNLVQSDVNVWAWTQAETRKMSILQHLRRANGIRFTARGDGSFWRIQLHTAGATAENEWANYQYTFGTIRDQVTVVDIPYSSLTFNDWGKYQSYDFEKETIWLLIISANTGLQDYGSASLQIWDFEVY